MRLNQFPIRQGAGIFFVMLLLGLVAATSGLAGVDSSGESTPPGTIEFVGRNTFATANGTFHSWRVVESQMDAADFSKHFVHVEVDLASVDTGSNRRDDHLRDPDFFEVEKYPVANIRVHSAKPSGESEDGGRRYAVQFDIDLHGVQATIAGEIVERSEEGRSYEGSLIVDRTVFGVGAPPNRWNPMSVKAEIPIHFRVAL
jgi:polyisoprenoid-binding protein YceI